ncbi:MAG: type II toxin-antitoxin system Phd/YefM family antitoxin [Anaerolineales bacterium]|nr:type II toxin-antitoxin system Phd/YefM family antitoxin [Anaerolineales bacterium]
MAIFNIHEAKTHFSKLLERVMKGEEVVIAKAGKPVARILPVTANVSTRKPGNDKGKVTIMPDFDAPLEEFAA